MLMIRVLVADDHAVVRRGVIQILSEDDGIVVVGEASSGRLALQALRQVDCDVILLDIAMPDGGGLEVLEEMHQAGGHPLVLILSMYPEKQYARRAFAAGASGYLTKESAPEELLKAIHKVAQGEKYVSQSLAEALVDELAGSVRRLPHEALSSREYQVMCLLAGGKTIAEIGAELALSVNTVSTYRRRILEKLGLKNNSEIIRYALQHELVK
jgi:two-component system, NarL family, invasion response regulator UvrY